MKRDLSAEGGLPAQAGFTLVELLIVVALVIISAGVTSDIILTLIRSYNKTRISNEIEQNGNFVILRLERELRDASNVDTTQSSSTKLVFTILNAAGAQDTVTYEVKNVSNGSTNVGSIVRRTTSSPTDVLLTNNSSPEGIAVEVGNDSNPNFKLIGDNPTVVKINFKMYQVGAQGSQFTGQTVVRDTIVVRGTY